MDRQDLLELIEVSKDFSNYQSVGNNARLNSVIERIMERLKNEPAMTKDGYQIIPITIPFRRIWKPNGMGGDAGVMSMKIIDCVATLTTTDEEGMKVEVGQVAACIGASWELTIKDDKESHLRADPKTIWNAYVEALNRKELTVK